MIARSFAPVRLLGCRNRNPNARRHGKIALLSIAGWTDSSDLTLGLVPTERLLVAHLVVPFPSPSLPWTNLVPSNPFTSFYFPFLSSPSPSRVIARHVARVVVLIALVDDEERLCR